MYMVSSFFCKLNSLPLFLILEECGKELTTKWSYSLHIEQCGWEEEKQSKMK